MPAHLHRASAVQLARRLSTRELSVEALATALIERVQAVEPELRAWAWFDADTALTTARRVDRGPAHGALFGLPLAVKDIFDTAEMPTAYGSPIYAGHRPANDAACVALARADGAWVVGKTVTTEFANMSPGPTRNPHHPDHTPGGSSSGSAAAIAAGLVPLALGTQTAGSVIRPAAFCGVVGYKPSPRRFSRAGVKANSDTLDEVGVFARGVDDAALLGFALARRLDTGLPSTHAFAPRIGLTLTSRAHALTPEMAAAVVASADRLAAAGASVRDVVWHAAFDALFDAHRVVQVFETARALAPEWLYRREQLSKPLIDFIDEGRRTDGAHYAAALDAARHAQQPLAALFEQHDVVLAPAVPGAAPAGLGSTGDPLFSRPWQLLGCPCVSVPLGMNGAGLPLGAQLIGRPGDDERVLAAAAWIEGRLA